MTSFDAEAGYPTPFQKKDILLTMQTVLLIETPNIIVMILMVMSLCCLVLQGHGLCAELMQMRCAINLNGLGALLNCLLRLRN